MDALDLSEWMMNDDEDDESDYYIENIEITQPPSTLRGSISGTSLCSDVSSTSKDNASLVPSLAQDSLESDSIIIRNADDGVRQRHITENASRWRFALKKERKTTWLIPANHRLKILWDVYTVLLSFASLYATHQAIRDRRYEQNLFHMLCNAWFFVDMILNFFTEHKSSDGSVIRDGKAVWARYLTSWFIIDALSLVPWEHVFVKPIIEMQNRRGFFKKLFFRSRGVIRVSRKLRGNHFRLFGRVANQTKHVGVSSNKLLRLIIRYAPKYVLFFKNMRGVLAVRLLRQVHWIRKLFKNLYVTSSTSRPVRSLQNSLKLVNRQKIVSFLSPERKKSFLRRYDNSKSKVELSKIREDDDELDHDRLVQSLPVNPKKLM